MKTNLSSREVIDINSQQIFTLEKKLYNGEFSIESVGDYLPGNLLINDLNEIIPTYINKSGCNILKHSVDELKEQGPEYFKRFFVPEEVNVIIPNYINMLQKQNSAHIYNYVQRVQSVSDASYKWYFASAKLMYTPGQTISDKMILIVNEVNSLGLISKKINSVLEESDWMKKNFKKYCRLNKREKEIITLIVNGKKKSSHYWSAEKAVQKLQTSFAFPT